MANRIDKMHEEFQLKSACELSLKLLRQDESDKLLAQEKIFATRAPCVQYSQFYLHCSHYFRFPHNPLTHNITHALLKPPSEFRTPFRSNLCGSSGAGWRGPKPVYVRINTAKPRMKGVM